MSGATAAHQNFSTKRFMLIALVAAGIYLVAIAAVTVYHSTSCKFHAGSFSREFSRDFDIDRTECRTTALRGIVIQLDGLWPYLTIRSE
jgi:hypothetical protein